MKENTLKRKVAGESFQGGLWTVVLASLLPYLVMGLSVWLAVFNGFQYVVRKKGARDIAFLVDGGMAGEKMDEALDRLMLKKINVLLWGSFYLISFFKAVGECKAEVPTKFFDRPVSECASSHIKSLIPKSFKDFIWCGPSEPAPQTVTALCLLLSSISYMRLYTIEDQICVYFLLMIGLGLPNYLVGCLDGMLGERKEDEEEEKLTVKNLKAAR